MPRSFLVKKSTDPGHYDNSPGSGCDVTMETLDSSFDSGCEHSDLGEEIDVVGDNDKADQHHARDVTDEYSSRNSTKIYEKTTKSPVGGLAMHSSQQNSQKISPSIAPKMYSPRTKSLSPYSDSDSKSTSSQNLNENINNLDQYSFLRQCYSDPKFWQNTLPSITHHYVSPFNFHRLPHAILAANSTTANSTAAAYHACFSIANANAPGLSSYSNAHARGQNTLRSTAFDSTTRMAALSALSQFDPRGDGKIPYAFVQPSPNPQMFSPRRAMATGVSTGALTEHEITRQSIRHKSDHQAALKIQQQRAMLDNNNIGNIHGHQQQLQKPIPTTQQTSKTLPWLHELPYNLPTDFDVSPDRVLKRHNEPPRYQCDACKKSYATFSGLSKHKQFHCESHVKKEFSCKYCEKTYNSLGALKMHIRTHTLPCKCQICGKAFSRPWLLQGHLRTHTGEKPFVCPQCGRAFADRSNLRAHLQTHSDIKKYSCTECSKTFSRMSLLVKHKEGSCPGMRSNIPNMISTVV